MASWSYRPTSSPSSVHPECVICLRRGMGEVSSLLAGHVCYRCLARKSYETANTRQVGQFDGLPMFSVEFEVSAERVSASEWQRTLLLLKHGYVRTEDSTVDEEYKSPIYRSLDPFLSVLPLLDSLGGCVTGRCGTHIHIDCPEKERLWGCEWEVFSPLEQYIEDHREQSLAFWGRSRSFNDWFNTNTRYDTVEFRLPRFRSAQQYLAVVQFCRQAGLLINEYLMQPQTELSSDSLCIGEDLLSLYEQALTSVQQVRAS